MNVQYISRGAGQPIWVVYFDARDVPFRAWHRVEIAQ